MNGPLSRDSELHLPQWLDSATHNPNPADHVTSEERRRATLVCLFAAMATVALIPFSNLELPHFPALLPAYQTILITAYLITAYLVFSFYRANKTVSLLYLCGGCIYTAGILLVQFFHFPGLATGTESIIGGPQTLVWLWCFWHIGPALAVLGFGLSEWVRPGMIAARPYRAARHVAIIVGLLLAASIASVTTFFEWMPLLDTHGGVRSVKTIVVALAIQAATLFALLVLWRATRFQTSLHVWLGVALIALLLDNAITMTAGGEPSIGWYAGLFNALLSAVIMLLIYLREINYVYLNLLRNARLLAASNAMLEVKVDQARLDALTGLPGRALFLEQAKALRERSLASGAAIAILFIDLDGFKQVNDSLGHVQGDAVLKKTADVLRSVMRDSDVAGRIGGDEFVVSLVSPAYSIETTAIAVADRIVKRISDIGYGIGCSVGISLCQDGYSLLESSLRQADAAMYEAKRNGKNRFVLHLSDAA